MVDPDNPNVEWVFYITLVFSIVNIKNDLRDRGPQTHTAITGV